MERVKDGKLKRQMERVKDGKLTAILAM